MLYYVRESAVSIAREEEDGGVWEGNGDAIFLRRGKIPSSFSMAEEFLDLHLV